VAFESDAVGIESRILSWLGLNSERETLTEQALYDDHPLDLVGAFVYLGVLPSTAARYCPAADPDLCLS
jgi:hypothetical protein